MSTEAFNTMRKNLVESVTGSALDWLAYMGTDAALAAIPDTNPPRYVVAGTLADIVKLLPATEAFTVPPLTAPAPLTDELKRERDSFERMFLAACADLGLVNEALGLDPDDGGADPILEAIEELKTKAAAVQFDADELRKLILNVSNTSHWCGAIGGDADDYAVALAKANAADEALFSYVKNLAAPAPQQSESIDSIANELEDAAIPYEGDFADTVRSCVEGLRDLAAAKAAPAAPVQTQIPAEIQGMADCMYMVRQELIEAGVIDASVAPMFIANAVVAKLQEVAAPVQAEQAQAEPVPQSVLDTLWQRVTDAREAAYTFGDTCKEAVEIALDGVLDMLVQADLALPAQAEQAAAVRAAALEEAADVLEAMNDASGDAAAYDNREQNLYELEREHAISDCVKAIRALATKEAAAQVPAEVEAAEYELHQDDMMVAGTSGKDAFNEILRYAAQYIEDGPVELYKVTRTKVSKLEIPAAAPSTTPSNDTSALSDTGGAK